MFFFFFFFFLLFFCVFVLFVSLFGWGDICTAELATWGVGPDVKPSINIFYKWKKTMHDTYEADSDVHHTIFTVYLPHFIITWVYVQLHGCSYEWLNG